MKTTEDERQEDFKVELIESRLSFLIPVWEFKQEMLIEEEELEKIRKGKSNGMS